jgi:hypothetical protein
MALQPPPFSTVDEAISLPHSEKSSMTIGQLRAFINGCDDDIVVWLSTAGKDSSVRPVQHMTAAPGYLLIS